MRESKKLKKFGSLLVASSLLAGVLAGCGAGSDDDTGSNSSSSDSGSTSSDGDTVKIGEWIF